MKTYNSPTTQITDCQTSHMLMSGNVSGGDIKGVKDAPEGGTIIEIF